MSNIIAGEIFEKIIAEVVQTSQTDFEENGVSQQTLLELKQTWQSKLSTRGVAQMPWDPKPVPPAPSQSSSSAMHNGQQYTNAQNRGGPSGMPRVKAEPATDANYDTSSYHPPPMNPDLAHQRAQDHLQQQYGNRASASLNAMQQQRGIALPGQQPQKPTGIQLPGQNPQMMQEHYRNQMRQQQAAQQPRIKTETDGASDWDAIIADRRTITAEDIARNDATIRDQILQASQERSSGLMQSGSGTKRTPNKSSRGSKSGHLASIPQLDGDFSDDEKPDIKDEEDKDAINSDLDSSGDENANAEEDDDEIDSMLCTYDKVQRVKNKWKCVLKDGVLSANGKEYLFHKATGEFEW